MSAGDIAWADGGFLPLRDVVIAPLDRGFALGDGVFETILWDGRRLRAFDRHAARLAHAAAFFDIPLPTGGEELARVLRRLARENGFDGRSAGLRVTLTRGQGPRGLAPPDVVQPRLIATAQAWTPARDAARLVTVTIRRNPFSPASAFKTLSYADNVLALREARAKGGDEALMLDVFGRISCASAANIFFLRNQRILTPPLSAGALPGVTRARVLALLGRMGLKLTEDAGGPESLVGVEAAFLTNALIGVRPIARIDDLTFQADHPLAARLALELAR